MSINIKLVSNNFCNLSNDANIPITVDNETYPSVTHYIYSSLINCDKPLKSAIQYAGFKQLVPKTTYKDTLIDIPIPYDEFTDVKGNTKRRYKFDDIDESEINNRCRERIDKCRDKYHITKSSDEFMDMCDELREEIELELELERVMWKDYFDQRRLYEQKHPNIKKYSQPIYKVYGFDKTINPQLNIPMIIDKYNSKLNLLEEQLELTKNRVKKEKLQDKIERLRAKLPFDTRVVKEEFANSWKKCIYKYTQDILKEHLISLLSTENAIAKLLESEDKPIVYLSETDLLLGQNSKGEGENLVGKMYESYRTEYKYKQKKQTDREIEEQKYRDIFVIYQLLETLKLQMLTNINGLDELRQYINKHRRSVIDENIFDLYTPVDIKITEKFLYGLYEKKIISHYDYIKYYLDNNKQPSTQTLLDYMNKLYLRKHRNFLSLDMENIIVKIYLKNLLQNHYNLMNNALDERLLREFSRMNISTKIRIYNAYKKDGISILQLTPENEEELKILLNDRENTVPTIADITNAEKYVLLDTKNSKEEEEDVSSDVDDSNVYSKTDSDLEDMLRRFENSSNEEDSIKEIKLSTNNYIINDNSILSPRYSHIMLINGMLYPTFEHFYKISLKYKLYDVNFNNLYEILIKDSSKSPDDFSRYLDLSNETDINYLKDHDYTLLYNAITRLCERGINTKFENQNLIELLLSTHDDRLLYEYNSDDKFPDNILETGNKGGDNYVGKFLQTLRDKIRNNMIVNPILDIINNRVNDLCRTTALITLYFPNKYLNMNCVINDVYPYGIDISEKEFVQRIETQRIQVFYRDHCTFINNNNNTQLKNIQSLQMNADNVEYIEEFANWLWNNQEADIFGSNEYNELLFIRYLLNIGAKLSNCLNVSLSQNIYLLAYYMIYDNTPKFIDHSEEIESCTISEEDRKYIMSILPDISEDLIKTIGYLSNELKKISQLTSKIINTANVYLLT
jgi:predicted NAD-dependent protein-ADP-ribosyltransferase YbiA (DUF1768 family)